MWNDDAFSGCSICSGHKDTMQLSPWDFDRICRCAESCRSDLSHSFVCTNLTASAPTVQLQGVLLSLPEGLLECGVGNPKPINSIGRSLQARQMKYFCQSHGF